MNSDIFGTANLPEEIKEELQERIDIVVHKLKFFPDKPGIIFISNLEDFAVHYNMELADLVNKAGGELLFANSWENLIDTDPSIIVLSFPEETVESSLPKISSLLQQPGFSDLKAAKENKVFIFRNDFLQSAKAAEKVDVLEAIAEIITPKYFNFGFEGNIWINFAV